MVLKKRSKKIYKYKYLYIKRKFKLKTIIFALNKFLSKVYSMKKRYKYKHKNIKFMYKNFKKYLLEAGNAIIFEKKENIEKKIEKAAETYVTDFKSILALNNYSDEYMLVQNFRDRVINILNSKILSNFLKVRSQYNFDLYSYLLKPSNLLFFNKLSNFLMKSGQKAKSDNIVIRFLQYLKYKYNILNPLKTLQEKIYLNIIPMIRTRIIGYKNLKTIGDKVSRHYRLCKSLKLFVKGAKSHNTTIFKGLVIEFFKLLENKSKLNDHNKITLNDIEKFRLMQNLRMLKC